MHSDRNKLFGTTFKGINIKKAQNIEEMEICVVCNLEDVESQFERNNPCDCQCVLHLSCPQMAPFSMTDDFEFCPLCTAYLPIDQLRARREWGESGDFEVEQVNTLHFCV